MATYNWGVDKTFTAAIDLSASQYRFVTGGSIAGEVTLNTTAGGSALGVLQNDPKAAEEAVVRVFGFTKVKADGSASALVYNAPVKAGSAGMCEGFIVGAACAWAMGITLEATTACPYVEIFLNRQRLG